MGQGAFYSERHDGFNIVYDCGELFRSKRSERLVENSFKKGDKIDILFISHFDADHINRIDILKKFKIKKVIMPLLHDDEKNFLNHFYQAIRENEIIQIFENPKLFFGRDTDIIYVNENSENNDINPDGISIEQLIDGSKISSGVSIKSILADWVYIPFNNQSSVRKTDFKNRFRKKGLDIDKFQRELSYAMDNSTTIKEIYNELKGGINSNSMIVYSGPINERYSIEDFNCCFCFSSHKAGCIYTGDVNLNEVDIESIYKKYWNYVGTIQIPHHGSKLSFKIDPFIKKHCICPLSYGNCNTFDHPSLNVLTQLIAEYCRVKHVTEKVDTIYIQNIQH